MPIIIKEVAAYERHYSIPEVYLPPQNPTNFNRPDS